MFLQDALTKESIGSIADLTWTSMAYGCTFSQDWLDITTPHHLGVTLSESQEWPSLFLFTSVLWGKFRIYRHLVTACSPQKEIQVMRRVTAVCENNLGIIRFQIFEEFSATFHLEISPVADSVAMKLQTVTDRSVAVCV